MSKPLVSTYWVRFLALGLLAGALTAADSPERPLVSIGQATVMPQLSASSAQVTFSLSPDPAAAGLEVVSRGGADGYPGISVKPPAAAWDLSEVGHIEAKVVNTCAVKLAIFLRIDNQVAGKNDTWNCEQVALAPGASGVVRVRFGTSWGKPGYALDAAKVSQVLLFTGKSTDQRTFRIETLTVGGAPGESSPIPPDQVRIVPEGGRILGGSVVIDDKQLTMTGGTAVVLAKDQGAAGISATIGNESGGELAIKPPMGRWNLRQAWQTTVTVHNEGSEPLVVKVRLTSDPGPTDWIASLPIAPGGDGEIVVPFANDAVWTGEKDSGVTFSNDVVSGVSLKTAGPGIFVVTAITAGVPAPFVPPASLGAKPPVEGDWVKTFADEFDGPTIDATKWTVAAANWWDKQSRFSKDNVILGDGVARLRFEQKRGHANDDPAQEERDYTTGFLSTYGLFTQRYGYFESRMKLPTAPGLWPAFWMMPDRGVEAGPEQWKRSDTKNGGMEFDIMEYLTRYGPFHYNIAMHWDGYQKEHKSTGTDGVWALPDADGYIVSGLLWAPGLLVHTANGREVGRWANERVASVPAHLMYTHVCGGWGGNRLEGTGLPDDFVIDWVRVWQLRERMPAPGEAPRAP